jgi:hypothetical protein
MVSVSGQLKPLSFKFNHLFWGFSGVNVPNNTNPMAEEISAEIPKFWKIPAQHLRIKHAFRPKTKSYSLFFVDNKHVVFTRCVVLLKCSIQ